MVERSVVLSALFKMLDVDSIETQVIAARTCCNLVFCSNSSEHAIMGGVLARASVFVLFIYYYYILPIIPIAYTVMIVQSIAYTVMIAQ